MGIERKHSVKKDGNLIRKMYEVKVPYTHEYLFDSVGQAVKFMALLEQGQQSESAYGIDGADCKLGEPHDFDPTLSTVRVMVGEVDDEVHGYDVYSCDHHIIKDSDVCGISKCYHNTEVREPRDVWEKNWRVTHLKDETIITCPQCAERIAEAEDCTVDHIDDAMIYAMWKMEQEVIERNG